MTDRLIGAVGSLWGAEDAGDTSMQADTTADNQAEEPESTEEEGHDRLSADPDTHPSETETDPPDGDPDQEQEAIDATITAYERQNTALRVEVTELTEQVKDLTAQVDTLEQEIAKPGLLDRVTAAFGSDTGDTQPTELRRARFSETAASLADTEAKTEETESTAKEQAEPTRAKEVTQEQAQPTANTSDQTRSASTHREQDSSTDRSNDRGFSL